MTATAVQTVALDINGTNGGIGFKDAVSFVCLLWIWTWIWIWYAALDSIRLLFGKIDENLR